MKNLRLQFRNIGNSWKQLILSDITNYFQSGSHRPMQKKFGVGTVIFLGYSPLVLR